MLREGEYGHDRRIGLRRPQLQKRVLGVPAAERGVVLGDGLQGINPRSPWSVCVQVIPEDLGLYFLQPRLEEAGLPEPSQVVRGVGPLQVLVGVILRVRGVRSEGGRAADEIDCRP